jgi:hypothetical protein
MTPASASPIATQETPDARKRRADFRQMALEMIKRSKVGASDPDAVSIDPLVMAERIVPELDRREALVTSLKAEVEELTRVEDENDQIVSDLLHEQDALESRLASLTGLVGDMREALALAVSWTALVSGDDIAARLQMALNAGYPGALELPAPAVSTTGEETVVIPKAALDWLNGTGPDDRGLWFGDERAGRPKGTFWWRSKFKRLCSLPPVPGDPVEEGR